MEGFVNLTPQREDSLPGLAEAVAAIEEIRSIAGKAIAGVKAAAKAAADKAAQAAALDDAIARAKSELAGMDHQRAQIEKDASAWEARAKDAQATVADAEKRLAAIRKLLG